MSRHVWFCSLMQLCPLYFAPLRTRRCWKAGASHACSRRSLRKLLHICKLKTQVPNAVLPLQQSDNPVR